MFVGTQERWFLNFIKTVSNLFWEFGIILHEAPLHWLEGSYTCSNLTKKQLIHILSFLHTHSFGSELAQGFTHLAPGGRLTWEEAKIL